MRKCTFRQGPANFRSACTPAWSGQYSLDALRIAKDSMCLRVESKDCMGVQVDLSLC